MSNRVLTISREFGSGGRTIGRKAAEKLGLPCYDAELIGKLEETTGLSKEYIAERGEYASHGSWPAPSRTVTAADILFRMIYGAFSGGAS